MTMRLWWKSNLLIMLIWICLIGRPPPPPPPPCFVSGSATACRRGGPATSGGSGAGRSTGIGATTAHGGRGGSLRGRGARGSRGGEISSSTTSVPGACADPADDDHDPELEDVETDVKADDLWERGPTGLPPIPTRDDEKIVLTPYGDTQWGEEQEDSRLPNGILGVLIREAFPGKVTYKSNDEPAWTWQHYNLAEDISDGDAQFGTALERVEESFWWWFKWANGKELHARRVVRNVVKRLIPQMFYEGRIQSVITYYNRVLGRKIRKKEACKIDLTVEQYMEAIPWWAQKAPHAWKLAAELKWCNEAWKVKSLAAKARRAKMRGASHRQGSCSHARYKKKLEVKHKRPISDIEAYAMARRGQEGTFCNQKTADKIVKLLSDLKKRRVAVAH